jgi:hypothetical protein
MIKKLKKEKSQKTQKKNSINDTPGSAMMIKYFAETASPKMHDIGAEKEAFGAWKERWLYNGYEYWLRSGLVRGISEELLSRNFTRLIFTDMYFTHVFLACISDILYRIKLAT